MTITSVQHFQSADISHPQIGDDEVVAVRGNHAARRFPVLGLVHVVTLRAQHLEKHAARAVLIVGD